ncbi:hypothetical protein ABMA57_11505 [Saccharospirillum sp. HFRX-1]|uniref:hypothetical protein n=1 Tax=unclassified Saccharospirillum TaxID=2633430 RepID=UPI003718B41A
MMKKELLSVFAVAALLAGCNSESNGGPGSLSFDVGGHWEISELEGISKHFMNIVVDPDGRFMGTQGDPNITIIGSDAGAIGLEGSGVSGLARYCKPITKTEDEPYPHECGSLSLNLNIEDDNTMVGELVMTDPTNAEGASVEVKVERLTDLNQPKDLGVNLNSTWLSLYIRDQNPGSSNGQQDATVNIDYSAGTFTYTYKNFSVQGSISEVADNIYSVKSFEGESITANGLAFVDADGLLHMGVVAGTGADSVILGDIYRNLFD